MEVSKDTSITMSSQVGKISQIIGPVIDVSFDTTTMQLPRILDALEITRENGQKVILECQKHIGEDTIRTVAMDSSDGLRRGMDVVATGMPIKMPIGDQVKGRLYNVLEKQLMELVLHQTSTVCPFTATHQNLKNYLRPTKYCLPVLKLSTC